MGLMVPRVESRAQAEEIVRYTKFYPMGDRGMAPGTAHTAYRVVSGTQLIREANAELLLILQIETQAGLDHLDEILSVPGLNVAYLGPFDLSTSLGIPWELNHPRMIQATNAFLRGCERHGVIPGIWVNSVKDGRNWMRRGARFLTYGADFLMVQEHSKQLLGALHPNRRPHGRSRR